MAEVFYPLMMFTFSFSGKFLECLFSVGIFVLNSETLKILKILKQCLNINCNFLT